MNIGDYDVAGFVVGAVERNLVLPKLDEMKESDVLIGLRSSGFHSNGFSLVRHVLNQHGIQFSDPVPKELLLNTTSSSSSFSSNISTIGELLLTPTRLYVKQILPLLRERLILGMCHITGGGFPENIPRVLPPHLSAVINAESWRLPSVFSWIKKLGNISNGIQRRIYFFITM